MLGKAQLRSYCRGQAVIALSSGEAEYYGLVSVTSETLGEQSYALDFGVKLKIMVWLDATAGAAIGSRRGLGKVKHISTIFLWCQEKVTSGQIQVGKVHTSLNTADILTKAIDASTLLKHMTTMGFYFPSGSNSQAYAALLDANEGDLSSSERSYGNGYGHGADYENHSQEDE